MRINGLQVRRGIWFFQEGSVLKPCDENLATQIEEGYIKLKPFRLPAAATTKVSAVSSTSTASTDDTPAVQASPQPPAIPRLKPADSFSTDMDAPPSPVRTSSPFGRFARPSTPTIPIETAKREMIWKLLGDMHMGKYVVYTNADTAWLLSDDLYGKLTASVVQTLTAGVHLGGTKLVRGYIEPAKKPGEKDKEVNETKSSTLAATVADGGEQQSIRDRVEEKGMEDYDSSEQEDPNRYGFLSAVVI